MTRTHSGRSGFTLIELLVVLSIMGLLAAISISAVGRFKQASIENFSNIQIRKVQVGLDQQHHGAVDTIKKEAVPPVITELTRHASGQADTARAKALHMKLRLRQEFPQTFAEVDATRFTAEFATPPMAPASQIASLYPPKALYRAAIGTVPNNPDLEGAALLYLILTQSRAGSNFDAENVGRVQPVQVGNRSMKVFVDFFDTPVGFRRWTDKGDPANIAQELSEYPLAATPLPKADPEDPDGRLGAAFAADWLPGNYAIALKLFVPNSATTRPSFDTTTVHPFDGRHRGPYAFSAGRDLLAGTDDDLLSFRIQQAGKGN